MYFVKQELFAEPLITYLKQRGWKLIDSEPDIAILRKLIGSDEKEIVLPRDRKYADYDLRIQEAIRYLSQLENNSELQIKEDLSRNEWDILRIRISGNQIGFGSIPYLEKMDIEQGIRKLLLVSARSIDNPKIFFKRLFSIPAEQWMKKCQAMAPEPGSYIITIQLPLDSDDENDPFSRKVAQYLMNSLNKVVQLSEKPNSFLDLKDSNLNANFCLELAKIKPEESSFCFDFEMNWSSKFPVDKTVPRKITVYDHYFPSIMRIGQNLKPKKEINSDEFIGKILTLRGEADDHGRMEGEVTFILFMEEEQIKAKAFFSSELYAVACEAHKENKYIRVSGSLAEKPRCSDLLEVKKFEPIS